VDIGEARDQRKADADARRVLADFCLPEGLEDRGAKVRRDARAGVVDGEENATVLRACSDPDR